MRLGEAMVKEGLITNDILAKALERQIIFGGRLGTNLVEMGAINEETLAKFLAKVLRVPYAEPSSFEDVPDEVLVSMPKDLAEKYTAFPIRKERNRLHLAMKDPNDIAVVDELRFIVGLDIRPYIASEMRIVFALEKYYGVKRDLRYVAVHGEQNTFDSHLDTVMPKSGEGAPVEDVPEDQYLGDESQSELYGQSPFAEPEPEPAPPVTVQPPPPASTAPPQAKHMETPAPIPPVRQAPPTPPPPTAVKKGPYEILASPEDREQIAGAVIEASTAEVSRAALFLVKGGVLTGWRAGGQGLSDGMVSPLSINLAEPTLFKEVAEDRAFYKGPVLQIPQNNALLDAMGGQRPQEAVAYPLIIKGKVVGVLYGDNGQGAMVTGNIEKLRSLMAKASMSLEILILKTKILAGE